MVHGRVIVYETEIETNEEFNNLSEKILNQNPYAEIWRWQNYAFKENMLKTIHDLHPYMEEIEKGNSKFNFKTIEKKD